MRFRFTYSHEVEGDFVASEPAGFDDAQLGFERDMEFYSLVEFYKAPFAAYGTNGIDNGARDWIKMIEKNYGADTLITVTSEIAPDNYTYENLYTGTIAIGMFVERIDEDHLLDMAFNQKSFWTSFLSRQDTPVDIQSPVSLDGEVIDVIVATDVSLPSQIVNYYGSYKMDISSIYRTGDEGEDYIAIIDWETVIIDEIDKFALGAQTIDQVDFSTPIGIFEAPAAGDYRVRFSLVSSDINFPTGEFVATQNSDHSFDVRVQKTNSSSFLLATKTIETVGVNSFLKSSFDEVITMALGEQLAIYGSVHSTFFLHKPHYIFGNRRLVWAADVNAATTTVVTLSGEQTIDGFSTSSSRVLVRQQVDPAENGIYVSSVGVWSRASDSDSSSELYNQAIGIISGAIYGGAFFRQTEIITTLGVSPVNWIEYTDTISGVFTAPIEKFNPYNGSPFDSFLEITADTTFIETTAQSFLLHDVGAMIADRIISKNKSFYSEFLGRTNTLAREYLANGCGSRYILAKGLQIRQYTLSEKPFFLSFNDWWEGVNPILNLGIGYDKATEIVGVYEAVPLPDISTWTETGIGSSWFGTNTTHVENVGLGFGLVESKRKYTPYAFIVGDAYRLTFAHSVVSAGALPVFRRLKVDTVTSGGVNQQRLLTQNSAGTDTVEFTAIAGDDRLSFIVSVQGIDTDNYFTVDLLTIEHFVESEIEVDVIRVEPKSFFFDDSSVSVNLSNIQKITRKYDPEHQFNSIKAGYQKWQSEEISGIDDPQTVRTWASRLKYIGKPLIKLSLFISASLALESLRRTTRIKSADHKHDNETFIVAVEETGGVFSPELSENFTGVTGLLNEDTRYNKRLTVARNLIRHMNLINGALQSYLGSVWRFVSGEGNFDMRSTMTGCAEDFDGIPVSEKQDFEVTDNFLFLPVIYEIEHYLTFTQYKLIKANRNKAIGLSLTTTGHKKAFIKSLSVNPVTGDLSLIVWAKEELDLSVATKPETPGRIFDFTFVTEFE